MTQVDSYALDDVMLSVVDCNRERSGSSMDLTKSKEDLFRRLRRDISDERVLDAMWRVPRELFVTAVNYPYAYDDRPLPIGEGQTISQPFIVALMTQALELDDESRVLELGTGSGYQTAILAELAGQVITVERLPGLSKSAEIILNNMGYTNISFRIASDVLGWPDDGPYDAILVTAAAPFVAQTLVDQLNEGGRLVIPVGSRWEQMLLQVIKRENKTEVNNLTSCRFVPLIGKEAWSGD